MNLIDNREFTGSDSYPAIDDVFQAVRVQLSPISEFIKGDRSFEEDSGGSDTVGGNKEIRSANTQNRIRESSISSKVRFARR